MPTLLRLRRVALSCAMLPIVFACRPDTMNSEASPAVPRATCGPWRWGAPTALERDAGAGRVQVASPPRLVATTGQQYVVGNDIDYVGQQPVGSAPLTVRDGSGRPLSAPPGRFMFVQPRGLGMGGDSFALVWGEPDSVLTGVLPRDWPPRPIVQLWTSTFAPGSGWGASTPLHHGAALDWVAATVSDPPSTGSSEGVIAVGPAFNDPGGAVTLLHARAGAWQVTRVHPTGPLRGALHPAALARGDHVYLAFVAAATDGPSDAGSVFLQASPDRGNTWTNAHLVSRSGAAAASEVRVLSRETGELILLWLLERHDAGHAIVERRSSDGGMTWSPAVETMPLPWATALRAVVDACGATHAVVESLTADGRDRVLLYATHDPAMGAWGAWSRVSATHAGMQPELRLDETGRPTLLYLGRPIDAPSEALLQTWQVRATVSASTADRVQP